MSVLFSCSVWTISDNEMVCSLFLFTSLISSFSFQSLSAATILATNSFLFSFLLTISCPINTGSYFLSLASFNAMPLLSFVISFSLKLNCNLIIIFSFPFHKYLFSCPLLTLQKANYSAKSIPVTNYPFLIAFLLFILYWTFPSLCWPLYFYCCP